MTISTEASQITIGCNGSDTVFSVPFVMDSAQNIAVILTDANGAQTTLAPTQYLVAINPVPVGGLWGTGGTVTAPISGSPYASGTTLTIQRILPLVQTTEIENQGNFYPQAVESGLDILEMQLQQVAARTGAIRGTWVSHAAYNFGDIVVDGINGNDTGNLYSCAIPNISTVWPTDLANGLWSLALNVQSIVNTLPTISNNQVLGNISGISATPYGVNLSALIDSAISNTQGSILYRSGSAWVALTPGTSGQVLQTNGASANPAWASSAGSGTVTNVATGTGLTGGPITSSGTLSFATVADKSLLANISGGTAAPSATTLSALLDNILSNTQGSIIYRGATTWVALGPGSSGQPLISQGSAANPAFTSSLPVTALAAGSGATSSTFWRGDGTWAAPSSALPSAFGIGSYVLASSGNSQAANDTISGSSLTVYSLDASSGGNNATSDTLTGTWRAMQSTSTAGPSHFYVIMWLRIS